MSTYDKPVAEELLLRAQRMEPAGPWSERLGDLFARAIVGSLDPRYGTTDAAEAGSPFALEARRTLEASTDPSLLAAAGYALVRRYRTTEAAPLGRRYLERAATLDPQNARARTALADLAYSERWRAIADGFIPPARVTPSTSSATPRMRRSQPSRKRIACSTFLGRRRAPI